MVRSNATAQVQPKFERLSKRYEIPLSLTFAISTVRAQDKNSAIMSFVQTSSMASIGAQPGRQATESDWSTYVKYIIIVYIILLEGGVIVGTPSGVTTGMKNYNADMHASY